MYSCEASDEVGRRPQRVLLTKWFHWQHMAHLRMAFQFLVESKKVEIETSPVRCAYVCFHHSNCLLDSSPLHSLQRNLTWTFSNHCFYVSCLSLLTSLELSHCIWTIFFSGPSPFGPESVSKVKRSPDYLLSVQKLTFWTPDSQCSKHRARFLCTCSSHHCNTNLSSIWYSPGRRAVSPMPRAYLLMNPPAY